MDKLFHALASAPRREILDIVRAAPGCSVVHVCKHFDVSRIAVMKHINVLEQANLVISEKAGRTRQLYFNVAPIQMIYDRWTDEYSQYWAGQMTGIKYRAESAQRKRTGKKKEKE
jgi:DNA-binding transcriptional ArsR family regulator